jgi:hypothetical protein
VDSQPIPLIADASGAAPQDPSAERSDDFFARAASPRYCPTALLAGFALLMAGHGRCVNTTMMLGDSEYAMWQLSCAKAMDDPELSAVAMRLYGYFADPLHPAAPVLGTP